MSIVKNTTGVDTAVTVWRFPKYNSQDPTTDIKGVLNDGTTGVTRMEAKYYLQLRNQGIGDNSGGQTSHIWGFFPGDSFIVKMEIDADSDGYIWGWNISGNEVAIKKVDNVIIWYINNAEVGLVYLEPGIHQYGWIGMEVNETKYSQPWYDGAVVPDSSPQTFTGSYITFLGGAYVGDYTPPECIGRSGSDGYGIRVYEAVAETDEGSWHLYPCTVVSGSLSWHTMFDALNTVSRKGMLKAIQDGSSTGGASSRDVGDFPTEVNGFGVQLFDIKHITGSGYNDLIALVAEDGGIDTQAGWTSGLADTNTSKITRSGEADKSFAFYLGKSSNSTNIPVPDGYTVTKAGDTYDVGELIKGRKPKWNIWTDQIRFGKYAVYVSSGRRMVHFNMFYDNAGNNLQNFKLENFEGYNSGTYHAPHIGLSGQINFEYYNGFCSKCTSDTKLMGPRSYDRCCVFAFNREGGGLGNIRLGNLPLWNYSTEEQNTQTGLANLIACGAGVRVSCQGADGNYQEIAFMCKSVKDTGDMSGDQPISFCTTSNADTKAMFRTVGFDATSIISDKSTEYMRDLLYEFSTRGVRGELTMLSTTDPSPGDASQIECTNLVPYRQGTAKGKFDNILYNKYPSNYLMGTGYDRFIVGNSGGTAIIGGNTYEINILGDAFGNGWGLAGQQDTGEDPMNQRVTSQLGTGTETNHGYGIDLGFALKTPNANSCLKIFGSDSDTVPVMAFMSVYAESKTLVSSSDEEVSPTYPYTNPVNFTTIQVSGEFKGCDATIDVGTVTRTDVSDTEVNFNVYLPYSEYGTYSKLVLYVSTNANIARIEFNSDYTFNVSDSVLSITVSDVVVSGQHKAQIAGYVYKNVVTIHSDITSSYHLSGKYFGFTKVVNACTTPSIITYNRLFLQTRYYYITRIQPSNYNISGSGDYNTNKWRGSAIFMWKDLTCSRNTATQRPSDGITCYMRVFAQNSGVHAWMPYLSKVNPSTEEGEAYFDDISENYHSWLNNTGETTVKDIYFHNPGELIENSSLGSSNFVDVWMTLWNTTQNPHTPRVDTQVTAANALDGKTLTLYEEVLHEPKDNNSGVEPVELCHFTFDSSSSSITGKDSDNQDTNYHMKVENGLTAPFFSRLPINSERLGQFDNTGFYHLQITNSAVQPSTGSMYYIKITTPSNNN